jgi:hypothetical protein
MDEWFTGKVTSFDREYYQVIYKEGDKERTMTKKLVKL